MHFAILYLTLYYTLLCMHMQKVLQCHAWCLRSHIKARPDPGRFGGNVTSVHEELHKELACHKFKNLPRIHRNSRCFIRLLCTLDQGNMRIEIYMKVGLGGGCPSLHLDGSRLFYVFGIWILSASMVSCCDPVWNKQASAASSSQNF